MMRLPAFAYHRPTGLAEVFALLAAHDDAVVVSGGTDLYPNLKRRQFPAGTVVSLAAVPGLAGITTAEDGTVRLGTLTTLATVASSPDVPEALAAAAALVASPQLRNRGTVGGNLCVDTRCHWLNVTDLWRQAAEPCLKAGGETCWVAPAKRQCWAVLSSDLAPVLVALEATVRLAGPDGTRTLPVAELYRDDGMAHLAKEPEEILVEVVVPSLGDRRAGYRKLRRRGSIDFPILGVAAALRFARDRCREARIVLGAVASAPVRATAAEELLTAHPWSAELVEEAGALAGKAVRPMGNTDLTSRYRKRMIPVYVRRLLTDLAGAR